MKLRTFAVLSLSFLLLAAPPIQAASTKVLPTDIGTYINAVNVDKDCGNGRKFIVGGFMSPDMSHYYIVTFERNKDAGVHVRSTILVAPVKDEAGNVVGESHLGFVYTQSDTPIEAFYSIDEYVKKYPTPCSLPQMTVIAPKTNSNVREF
jgi:hypothetical protein